jgi:hypothetical protein
MLPCQEFIVIYKPSMKGRKLLTFLKIWKTGKTKQFHLKSSYFARAKIRLIASKALKQQLECKSFKDWKIFPFSFFLYSSSFFLSISPSHRRATFAKIP